MLTYAAVLLAVGAPLIAALPQDPPVSLVVPRGPLTTGSPGPTAPRDKFKEVKCTDLKNGATWIPLMDYSNELKTSRIGFLTAVQKACRHAYAQQRNQPDRKYFEISVGKYPKSETGGECTPDDPSTPDVDESIGDSHDESVCWQVWLSHDGYGKVSLSIDLSGGGKLDVGTDSCYAAMLDAFDRPTGDEDPCRGAREWNDTQLGSVLMESGAYYVVNATKL
ncbi:hypothetical protein BDV96DRAFT_642870 [Lophiotrema nucula]|uniref:Ecp2 effector protein domain-containing protein n=1 Tax=Lophiotrema nucula TaxID=690887 RepID=A0A6A5ZGS6_9PLEO|nr:hypothetical protein BDV96DRAFT_642870 [Lophiotrema nucula]